MPTSSSPPSRPKTPAQTVAIWLRKATSVKGQVEFLQALHNGTIDPTMRNKRGETLLHVLAEVDDTTVFDAVFARLKRVRTPWPARFTSPPSTRKSPR